MIKSKAVKEISEGKQKDLIGTDNSSETRHLVTLASVWQLPKQKLSVINA